MDPPWLKPIPRRHQELIINRIEIFSDDKSLSDMYVVDVFAFREGLSGLL